MGCAASSQENGVVNSSKVTIKKDCIDPETGEMEPCDKMGVKQQMITSPLIKTNSLTITDKSEQHAKTGEEPAHPLPEGDYGDMKLGITVSMSLCVHLSCNMHSIKCLPGKWCSQKYTYRKLFCRRRLPPCNATLELKSIGLHFPNPNWLPNPTVLDQLHLAVAPHLLSHAKQIIFFKVPCCEQLESIDSSQHFFKLT